MKIYFYLNKFQAVYEEYTSRICFISNTYYYESNESIPNNQEARKKNEIKYYQWVSFILLSQALIFYLPRILWRSWSRRSGLDVTDIVEAAYNYKSAEHFAERDKHISYMVRNIDQYVDDSRRYDKNRPVNPIINFLGCLIPCAGRYLGNYLVFLYFVIKIVYIVNTVIQMILLSIIFGKSWFEFGFYFVEKIFTGGGWSIESKYFPSNNKS
jgi:innexin